MSTFTLKFDRDEKLACLSLVNPDKRNAITFEMWRMLPALLEQAKPARVLLLTGEGSHFSAGADIHELGALQGNPGAACDFRKTMQTALQAVARFPNPTIAQISGTCFGAGVAMIMACDLRFADQSAQFCIPPARLGLLYPQTDINRMIALIGPAMTKQLLFSGQVVSAKNAAQSGLINAVQPIEKTLELISSIGDNSARSVASLKQMVDGYLPDPDAAFDARFNDKDFATALLAFAEKRRPDYS